MKTIAEELDAALTETLENIINLEFPELSNDQKSNILRACMVDYKTSFNLTVNALYGMRVEIDAANS